jgi:putative oxidoreductase
MDLKLADTITYAVLRIVTGLAFSQHGFGKILGILGDPVDDVGSQIWFGGLIELVGGVLIALGLATRAAAFLASGTMAVAYIQFHWKGALDANFFPVKNHGELAVVYCFLFLFFTIRGSGPVSIDRLIFGPRSQLAGT